MIDLETLKKYLTGQMPSGLAMLRQMVEINSFTTNREGVNRLAQLTAQCFASLGFTPELVASTNSECGNHLVLTRRGTTGRSIAMISHLDTVFPPEEEIANHFHWQVEGNLIFGPGTLDIKGGTVMMWLVLSALQVHAPNVFNEITWKLFWNSSEERLSPDFDLVCRDRFEPVTIAALVFEAENRSGKDRLMVAARKGRSTWRVTVKGRGAHAGGNLKGGANALVQLAMIIQRIDALTDFSKELTFNVGNVRGGTVLNRVPHLAVAEGEFRAFSPAACEEAKARLLQFAGPGQLRSLADGYPCEVLVEITSESRPWPRNPHTDKLLDLWKDAAQQTGESVVGELRGGLSDGNNFWDLVPTLDGLGPWGDNDHCSERAPDGSKLPEFVEVSSFVPKALINVLAILNLIAAPH